MKNLFKLFLSFFLLFSFVSAQEYIYFYGNGCAHCAKVEKYFKDNDVEKNFSLSQKEIYFNRDNLELFNEYVQKLELPTDQVGIPMMIIEGDSDCSYLAGDRSIISFFDKQIKLLESDCDWCDHDAMTCEQQDCTHENCIKQWEVVVGSSKDNSDFSPRQELIQDDLEQNIVMDWEDLELSQKEEDRAILRKRLSFFGIMMPAALADSINPCAFAVMLLLLSAILSRHKDKRKTLLSGLMFSLSVFVAYFAMGLWLFSALANMTNTYILKIIVWSLWIFVWLANIKDFFWYGKWFVMEVPLSWRPAMQRLINRVSSPWWAFFVWLLVSIFLLPCSSGPYFTILGYLSAESKELHTWWYIYLLVYNLIFVLPMFFIALLVSFWYSSVEKLAKLKNENTKLIHLIVWLLMLGLWIYVFVTM